MAIFGDEFQDMMPARVTVQIILSRSNKGVPVYGSPQVYIARINTQTRNIIGADGQQVVARGCCWLDTVDPITVNDRVTFPDGSLPILLVVNVEEDENGPAFTKLFFQ
jgi:hypothetical protein